MAPFRKHADLPGFTYDESTNRYVKILPNHHAKALGGAAKSASSESVRDVKAQRKRRREEEVVRVKLQKSRITRSGIHRNSLPGISMILQHGFQYQQRSLMDLRAEVWCHLIWDQHLFAMDDSWYLMGRNHYANTYMTALSDHNGSDVSPPSRLETLRVDYLEEKTSRYVYSGTEFGRASSMNFAESSSIITTFSRDDPNLAWLPPKGIEGETDPTLYRIFKPSIDADYWCANMHPDTSNLRLAVGTQSDILVCNPISADILQTRRFRSTWGSVPTLSIQWKSDHVIVAGQRNSTVRLFDVRAEQACLRLRHATAAMKIHCIDDSRILLGGPNHLDMYDLRYTKMPHGKQSSEPWLHYHSYNNKRSCSSDIDVSPRLGLLAVALEHSNEIWNLWTGSKCRDLVQSEYVPHLTGKTRMIGFLRPGHKAHFFAEEADPEGVWMADDSGILEWHTSVLSIR